METCVDDHHRHHHSHDCGSLCGFFWKKRSIILMLLWNGDLDTVVTSRGHTSRACDRVWATCGRRDRPVLHGTDQTTSPHEPSPGNTKRSFITMSSDVTKTSRKPLTPQILVPSRARTESSASRESSNSTNAKPTASNECSSYGCGHTKSLRPLYLADSWPPRHSSTGHTLRRRLPTRTWRHYCLGFRCTPCRPHPSLGDATCRC